MAAGVKAAPANKEKTNLSQSLYEIVEAVADRFKISPFEIMQQYIDEVIAIWCGAVISMNNKHKDQKRKGGKADETVERVRVTSKTATWH